MVLFCEIMFFKLLNKTKSSLFAILFDASKSSIFFINNSNSSFNPEDALFFALLIISQNFIEISIHSVTKVAF